MFLRLSDNSSNHLDPRDVSYTFIMYDTSLSFTSTVVSLNLLSFVDGTVGSVFHALHFYHITPIVGVCSDNAVSVVKCMFGKFFCPNTI